MNYTQRLAVRFVLRAKLDEIYGNAFQDFFHDLMCLRYKDFLDVRTAGNLGDVGSDGISLVSGKLYSCYGPETVKTSKIVAKVRDDLEKALEKRRGEFHTFVFVHSDRRGMHPIVSQEIAALRNENPELEFEYFGFRHFRDEASRLSKEQVEDLLQQELPVQELVYRVELDEIETLLKHLKGTRPLDYTTQEIHPVSKQKLDFNSFGEDTKDEIRQAIIRSSALIDKYYADAYRVAERDEIAARFREEFEQLRESTPGENPDEIFYQMELFLLGNLTPKISERRAATVVLAYFFQSCDIFDDAPEGWAATTEGAGEI